MKALPNRKSPKAEQVIQWIEREKPAVISVEAFRNTTKLGISREHFNRTVRHYQKRGLGKWKGAKANAVKTWLLQRADWRTCPTKQLVERFVEETGITVHRTHMGNVRKELLLQDKSFSLHESELLRQTVIPTEEEEEKEEPTCNKCGEAKSWCVCGGEWELAGLLEDKPEVTVINTKPKRGTNAALRKEIRELEEGKAELEDEIGYLQWRLEGERKGYMKRLEKERY